MPTWYIAGNERFRGAVIAGAAGGGSVAVDATGLIANSGGAVASYDYTGLTTVSASTNGIILFGWNNNQENFSPAPILDPAGVNLNFTFIGRVIANSGIGQMEIWGIIGTVATGAHTIRLALSPNDRIYASAVSFTGVNQGSIASAFPNFNSNRTAGGGNTDASLSVTITSATGHIAVCGACSDINTPGSLTMNNTQIDASGFNIANTDAYASGAASVGFTATQASVLANIAIAGCDVSS